MKLSKFRQIILEELQRFANESMWDAYYAKHGVDSSQRYPDEPKPEPQPYQPQDPLTKSPKGEFVGQLTTKWGKPMQPPVAVYKNPKTLDYFEKGIVGALTSGNLDLYVAENSNGMHLDLVKFLAERGVIPQSSLYLDEKGIPKYFEHYPSEFIMLNKIFNQNIMMQGAMYDSFPSKYAQILNRANNDNKFTEKKGDKIIPKIKFMPPALSKGGQKIGR